jgi:hypothetical protein
VDINPFIETLRRNDHHPERASILGESILQARPIHYLSLIFG